MLSVIAEYVAGILLIIGSAFALIASIGLWRLPDIYCRMHAASKTGTLGSGLLLAALAVHAGDSSTVLRALAGITFFLLTAPISAHLLAKAAHNVGYKMSPISRMNQLEREK